MRLQYVASACVVIEEAGVKVICDPWLTSPIYGGAWYHNPPLTVGPDDFADCEAIYLSHINLDHTDPETLKRWPSRPPVYLAAYAEPFFANQVRALGFPVTELLPGQRAEFGPDFSLEIIPADDCNPQLCGRYIGCAIRNPTEARSYQLDSLALFTGGGGRILNVNDCPYALASAAIQRLQTEAGWRQPDLLLVGYTGAGPWPQCFPH